MLPVRICAHVFLCANKALEAEGAIVFANAADAVKGVDRVHLTLADDASVDAAIEGARAGFDALRILRYFYRPIEPLLTLNGTKF